MPHLSEEKIKLFEDLWGVYPEQSGTASDKIILGAKKEEIDSILVLGSDPILTYPDGEFVREGLEKLDFLVVADMFETKTTQIADVVLPLACISEMSGIMVNLEGRAQRFDKAVDPSKNVLPGYEMINRIASEMKAPLYESEDDLHGEIDKLLDHKPSPAPIPGLLEVKYFEDKPEGVFNIPLFVCDELHHFGHLTEKSNSLSAFCGEAALEISPSLAEKLHAEEGTLIRVESEVGKVILPVHVSEFIDNDVAMVYRNFSTTPVNVLQMRKHRVDYVRLTRVEEK
jgi:predicted molibdopterin-dependent oxidoreductase YjgC